MRLHFEFHRIVRFQPPGMSVLGSCVKLLVAVGCEPCRKLWPPVRLPADANLGGRVAELGIMRPSVGRTETRKLMVDGYRVSV
jgi:hypothetical protein